MSDDLRIKYLAERERAEKAESLAEKLRQEAKSTNKCAEKIKAVESALKDLVDGIQAIFDDPSFKSREAIASIHGFAYTGPHVTKQMKVARVLLGEEEQ